jgi:sRNA-binding protein
MVKMPWIKVSSEAHKDMKQYLVDIEGIGLGELVEACYEYAMQNLKDFEAFLELEETDETKEESEEDAAEEEETDQDEGEEKD